MIVADNLDQNKKAPLIIFMALLKTFVQVTADCHFFNLTINQFGLNITQT